MMACISKMAASSSPISRFVFSCSASSWARTFVRALWKRASSASGLRLFTSVTLPCSRAAGLTRMGPAATPAETPFPFSTYMVSPAYRFSFRNFSSASAAAFSSSPSMVAWICIPALIPIPMTVKIRFRSPFFPLPSTLQDDLKPLASFTSCPAGLAWIPAGSLIVYVNCTMMQCLLVFVKIK